MDKAAQGFEEILLQRGDWRVEWEYIGEGWSGDYNPENDNDTPLLRFTVSKFDPVMQDDMSGHDGFEGIQDGSYCTRMPIDSPTWMLVQALGIILEAAQQPSPKRRLEELSWLCPEDFKGEKDHIR